MIIDPRAMLRRDSYPVSEPEPDPDPVPVSTTPPSPPGVTVTKMGNQITRTRGERTVRYGECQKNHAAATGGNVVDGCCEFMPGGEEGTLEMLKCAACGCHRSFHKKEIDRQDPPVPAPYSYTHRASKHLLNPALYCSSPYKLLESHAMHRNGDIARRSSSSEDMSNVFHRHPGGKRSGEEKGSKKKRYRTKINQEQKEKMKEFAERLGWRILKKDEEEVDKFCSEVNLKRQVFKVWMHNNKQAMKRNTIMQN